MWDLRVKERKVLPRGVAGKQRGLDSILPHRAWPAWASQGPMAQRGLQPAGAGSGAGQVQDACRLPVSPFLFQLKQSPGPQSTGWELSVLGLRLRPCNSSPTPLPPDPRGSLSSLHSSFGPSCQNTRPGIFQTSTCSPGLPAGTETFRSEASGGDSFLHSSPHPGFHPMTLNADSRAAKGFLPESVYFSVAE